MKTRLTIMIIVSVLLFTPMLADDVQAEEGQLYARIKTNTGDVKLKLFEEDAPDTVDNFVRYAEDDFYQNTIFHRVIKDFMIQGGGYRKDLTKKSPTYDPIENEAEESGHRNRRGTIAMARTSDPDSATSQFFINTVDNTRLDWDKASDGYGYCVFGKVVKGMDVVDDIESVKTGSEKGMQDVPKQDIVIKDVTVFRQSSDDGNDEENSGIVSALTSNMILLEIIVSIIAAVGVFYFLTNRSKKEKDR